MKGFRQKPSKTKPFFFNSFILLLTGAMLVPLLIIGCEEFPNDDVQQAHLTGSTPPDGDDIAPNGTLTLTFDNPPQTVMVNGLPATVQGETATWQATALAPGQPAALNVMWDTGRTTITLNVKQVNEIIPFSGEVVSGEVEVFFDKQLGRERAFVRFATDNSQLTYTADRSPVFFKGQGPNQSFTLGFDEVVVFDDRGEIIDSAPFEDGERYAGLSAQVLSNPTILDAFIAFTTDLELSIEELRKAGVPLDGDVMPDMDFIAAPAGNGLAGVRCIWKCASKLRNCKNKAWAKYNKCLRSAHGRKGWKARKEWIENCKTVVYAELGICATEYLICSGKCLL